MKYCVHCGKELFDEAVMCPACKTEQPTMKKQKNIKLPKISSKVKDKTNTNKIKPILKLVVTSICCLVMIFASVVIGYQVMCSTYIVKNLPVWEQTFNGSKLTEDELNDLENDVERLDPYKFSVLNSYKLTELIVADFDTYQRLPMQVSYAKRVVRCYNSYTKKNSQSSYSIPQDILDDFVALGHTDFLVRVNIDPNANLSGTKKYLDMYDQMKPSAEKIRISVDYISPDTASNIEYRVKNENVFPINSFSASYGFSIMYIPLSSYSTVWWSNGVVDLSQNDTIMGGEEKTYNFTFNADDYNNTYHDFFYWEIQNSDVVVNGINDDGSM